jgi:hypothetical protein
MDLEVKFMRRHEKLTGCVYHVFLQCSFDRCL